MGKTLSNTVCGALMGATTLFAPMKSHAEDLEGYLERTYTIELMHSYGEQKQEEVQVLADLDEENSVLRFSYLTEDFDKEDWTKEEQMIPFLARYTNINHSFTRVFVLHPKEVKISNIEQIAYLVPQHEGEELRPLEESPKAQAILKAGETLLDWALAMTGIPFADELFDEFVRYSVEREEEHYDEAFKRINENYTATRIPSFPVDRFGGFTETARGYRICFDMSEAPKEDVPMSLWMKLALGDPSQSAHSRYGELENAIINFSLMGEKEISPKKPAFGLIDPESSKVEREKETEGDLISYYKFDEGDASTIFDSVGDNNGIMRSRVSWTTDSISGYALDFGGGYIVIPNSHSLNPETIRLDAWAYLRSYATERVILNNERSGTGYTLSIDNQKGRFSLGLTTGCFTLLTTTNFPLNTWCRLVGEYDGFTMRLYLNNALENSRNVSGKLRRPIKDLRIGAAWHGGSGFDGIIDEIRISE